MAITDNRTHLQDCENSAEISGDTDATPTATTNESGFVIEGTNAVSLQITNATEHILFDQDLNGSTFNLDLSDSTIYIVVKDNLTQPYLSLGGMVCLNDGADGAGGDDIGYECGGNDVVGLPYAKRYHVFKLDGNQAAVSPGSSGSGHFVFNGTEAGLNFASILQVGYGANHLAKAQGTVPNAWMDGIYYIANSTSATTGYAATISGGTVSNQEEMTDVVGDDEAIGAGMFASPISGIYYIFVPTEWGDAGTGSSYFLGEDETWVYLADNGGGRPVGANHMPMRFVGNATGTNSFEQLRVVNINIGIRIQFYWDDADFDIIDINGSTFIDFGVITCPGADIDKNLTNTTFNNGDQVIMNGMNMDGITFNGALAARGAVLLDTAGDSDNASDVSFTADAGGGKHAIEITATGSYDFDNWTFSGYFGTGNDAAVFNDSGGAVTINVLNGGDTPSVRNGTGASTTINNTVTIDIGGVAEGTAVKCIANETVGTITVGDVLDESLADATGVATWTINYEAAFDPSGLDILIRARNQGLATAAIADDGGVQTDETTNSNSPATNDMTLTPTTPVDGDAYLLGHPEQFTQLKIDVSDIGSGFAITWQYWNGAWTALSGVTDGTSSFSTLGENIVSWTLPGDWATTTENSQGPYYYVRALVGSVAGPNQARGRMATLDVTRYLPIPPTGNLVRTITSDGLTATLAQAVDSISIFDTLG